MSLLSRTCAGFLLLLLSLTAGAAETLTVTFTTSSAGGQYANKNAIAVWAMANGTTYSKTFGRWVGNAGNAGANNGIQGLSWWRAKAGNNNGDVDGYMGATQSSHAARTATWNCSVKGGVAGSAADGSYTIWVETGDDNNPTASGVNVNGANRFSFAFTKNGIAQSGTVTAAKFSAISWSYTGRTPTAPTVTSVTPSSGPASGGSSVIIAGTSLTGATAVTFAGTNATSFTVNSATQITATSPAGTAGAATVAVTTPSGSGSLAGGFTYIAAPVIASITPNSGSTAGGASVTIAGSNLGGASVSFGGSAGTGVTATATQITCTSPAHAAGAVNVVVTTGGGSATSTNGYTYAVAAPTLASLSPVSGSTAGGTSVVLTGTNLSGSTAVTFGGTPATGVTVNSATQITCTSPAHAAGAVDVAVTSPGGTATKTSGFTFNAPGAPGISSLSPVSGLAAGGNTVTITGSNLTGTSSVSFGGAAATGITVNSATQVTCTAPAHALGAVDVALTATGGTTTAIGAYTYVPPTPTISTVSPGGGSTLGGTSVIITGANLSGAAAVTFGGTAATAFTVDSATQISATSPAHAAGAVNVAVSTAGGTATKTSAFTYATPAPTISSVSPLSGSTLGNTLVTVNGSFLTGATAVSFGGSPATSITVINDGQLTCRSPAHAFGSVTLAVTTPGGSGSLAAAYAYVQAAPTISSLSLDHGPLAGGTSITITGTNLVGITGITFGGTAATAVTSLGATQVSCTSPAHAAGAVDVVVTANGGPVTAAGAYAYADPVSISSQPVAPAPVADGAAFTLSLSAGGTGPFTYQWRKGGVDIAGEVAASFTVAAAVQTDAGSYDCVVANDYGQVVSNAVAVTILPPVPVLSSGLAANAIAGTAFSYQITASNHPTAYAASGLPAGLGIDTATGLISGTPAAAGGSSIAISASNAGGSSASRSLVLTVDAGGSARPLITSAGQASATVGQAFAFTITASATPAIFSTSALPAWLSLDAATGVLSGTPASAGDVGLTVSATKGGLTGSNSLVIHVSNPASTGSALLITFTTTAPGGTYAPKNVVACWIETDTGTFVRTIGDWSGERRVHLTQWIGKAGAGDTDGVMGATRLAHGQLIAVWDLKDRSGATVPDGAYKAWIETVDANGGTPKNLASIAFTKTGSSVVQGAVSQNGYSNLSAAMGTPPAHAASTYPAAPACGSGSVYAFVLLLGVLLSSAMGISLRRRS